jgi:hypothetical protein
MVVPRYGSSAQAQGRSQALEAMALALAQALGFVAGGMPPKWYI